MNKTPKQIQSQLSNFRRAFTVIIVFNLIFLIERATFDFLGFMFGMIIADMLFLIFLIIGLSGAYQYRVNYVATSTLSALIWIAWNIFVICVYLNIGILDKYDPYILNLNTGKRSWWFTNSIGCSQPISTELERYQTQRTLDELKYLIELSSTTTISTTTTVHSTTATSNHTSGFLKGRSSLLLTATVSGRAPNDMYELSQQDLWNYTYLDGFMRNNCLMPFYYIEIIHAGVLIFLGIFYIIFGILLSNAFNDEDDSFDYIGGFDTVHIIGSDQQPTLPRNAHIRLEPLYA